eukprot:m.132463 g.132463  ORF g.132463 m.132463 type:complete len:56 (-) comp13796_c0_seq1:2941-3108(-)
MLTSTANFMPRNYVFEALGNVLFRMQIHSQLTCMCALPPVSRASSSDRHQDFVFP